MEPTELQVSANTNCAALPVSGKTVNLQVRYFAYPLVWNKPWYFAKAFWFKTIWFSVCIMLWLQIMLILNCFRLYTFSWNYFTISKSNILGSLSRVLYFKNICGNGSPHSAFYWHCIISDYFRV